METKLEQIAVKARREPNLGFTSLSHRVISPSPARRRSAPSGVPTVADRALQLTTAEVLSAIYEQDFLPCSFGGRQELSAHHALATLNEVIAGGMIGWVLEADLKNFFGSLNHDWVLRFVELE
jgi:RNA-directed DNA polymerase